MSEQNIDQKLERKGKKHTQSMAPPDGQKK